jgi:hypothetical protein
MAKIPAFQFYPGDWIQDTRILTLSAKGAWIEILCALWRSHTRGSLTLPLMGWARLLGSTADQSAAVIGELVDMRICASSLDDDLVRRISSGDRKAEVRPGALPGTWSRCQRPWSERQTPWSRR